VVIRTAAPTPSLAQARAVAASVCDPEVPVLTIDDLGVLRGVRVHDDAIVVTITPTYSGAPRWTPSATISCSR
jgi:ring-1,2-phenylacetyl-CoA epoxidase subunit PaaD